MSEGRLGRRIGFGKPVNFEQAEVRLPDRTNPMYKSDPVIEHLAHLKEFLGDVQTDLPLFLPDRFAPFSQTDMVFMEKVSLYREEVLVTANWECITEDFFPWNEFLPVGDEEYRWWQVCRVSPKPRRPAEMNLVSIELNPEFDLTKNRLKVKAESDFYLGFVFDNELRWLLDYLGRRGSAGDDVTITSR